MISAIKRLTGARTSRSAHIIVSTTKMRTWRSALRQESSANCGNCLASVAHREALADVLGLLDLIDDGDGEILAADAALALGILDQLVEAAAELAGALAGRDRGRRRDGRPVEVVDLLDFLVGLQRRQRGRRLHALLRHVVVMALAV